MIAAADAELLDRVVAFGSTTAGCGILSLAELPPRVFEIVEKERRLYERHDVENLLNAFARPRLELVDALWAAFPRLLANAAAAARLAHILPALRRRLYDEYSRMRSRLTATTQHLVDMDEVQILALVALFRALLQAECLLHRQEADAAGRIHGPDAPASDFAYVAAIAGIAGGLCLDLRPDLPLAKYSLHMVHQALGLLVRAIHRTGAHIKGLTEYWGALWDRVAQLLSLEDEDDEDDVADDGGDAAVAAAAPAAVDSLYQRWGISRDAVAQYRLAEQQRTTTADPAQSGLYDGEHLTEPVAHQSDVANHRLTLPLVMVHRGRRVRLYALQLLESLYYHHMARIDAALAHLAAAVGHSAAAQKLVAAVLAANGYAQMTAFLSTTQERSDDAGDRYLTEYLSDRVAPAHLMLGEVERYVLHALDEACRPSGRTLIATNPHAAEVISSLRIEEYAPVSRYDDMDVFARVCEDYMHREMAVAPHPLLVAPDHERLAVVVLLAGLDASMIMAGCPVADRFSAHCWIEEMQNGGGGSESTTLALGSVMAPRGPLEAYRQWGLRSCCAVVRLLRRTFVVIPRDAQGDRIICMECPSLLVAAYLWFALSHTRHTPPELEPVVEAVQRVLSSSAIATTPHGQRRTPAADGPHAAVAVSRGVADDAGRGRR